MSLASATSFELKKPELNLDRLFTGPKPDSKIVSLTTLNYCHLNHCMTMRNCDPVSISINAFVCVEGAQYEKL